jgi:O-antigen ligase
MATSRRTLSFEQALRYLAFFGVAAFTFVVPWEDQLINSPDEPRISRYVGLLAFAVAIPALVFHGRRHKIIEAHVFAAVFAAVTVASVAWSNGEDRIAFAITIAQLVGMFWLIWEFADTRNKVRGLLAAFVAGGAIDAVSVIYEYLFIGASAKFGRYSGGPLVDPNDVASVMALSVPMAWYLVKTTKSRLLSMALVAYIPIASWAVILTASRGGFVILAVGLLVIPFTLGSLPVPARVIVLATMAIGLAVAPGLLPEDQLNRATSTADEDVLNSDNSAAARWDLFIGAAEGFAENPVKGVGADGAERFLGQKVGFPQGAHNTLASVGLQLGLIGFVPFLLLLISVGVRASRGTPFQRRSAMMLFWAVVVMMMPAHTEATKRLWLVLGIVLVMSVYGGVADATRRVTSRATGAA